MIIRWLTFALVLGHPIVAACSSGGSAGRGHSAADSLSAAREVWEGLVKDKLISPTVATFSDINMKRDPATNAFVGRGEATAPNPLNVPITHRFVCMIVIDKSGRGNVVFRKSNPELYEEMVTLMGL
jgi:hypothetical protein